MYLRYMSMNWCKHLSTLALWSMKHDVQDKLCGDILILSVLFKTWL